MPVIGYGVTDGAFLWEKGLYNNAKKFAQEVANSNQMPMHIVEITTLGYKRIETIYPNKPPNWKKMGGYHD